MRASSGAAEGGAPPAEATPTSLTGPPSAPRASRSASSAAAVTPCTLACMTPPPPPRAAAVARASAPLAPARAAAGSATFCAWVQRPRRWAPRRCSTARSASLPRMASRSAWAESRGARGSTRPVSIDDSAAGSAAAAAARAGACEGTAAAAAVGAGSLARGTGAVGGASPMRAWAVCTSRERNCAKPRLRPRAYM
eukprot:scaffold6526_cov55-Phaeocystis_antarctica.AAC.1